MDIENIYELYYRDVYHFALYFTNNKQEAEDITQETFMKVMKNHHTLKESSSMKTWIISIARNTAIDLKRKQKWVSFLPDWFQKEEVDSETTEQKIIKKDEWVELQDALLRLKPHYRTLVILRGLKELTIKEVSEILEISEQKVRVDYHRAIQQLKKQVHSFQEGWGMTNE
ncbi:MULTISPECIES: RNA polymerase sigma factor [unclassified Bacillus (in: firmicutes)]|uniref:RNA polymerase sigma factor n=1 Tax=unclassified Bacillus (in: firmicutes) TaxID=185979 RepID=UPI0008E9CD54|nr:MULTISPECIES: RNA polymerase sigma factor [unclassified Bacillus (in: firmicutes)]SFA70959.1 RNA polymerase sigma-70 factor, ECF subfamily [Bacillus sp. UNCCL13]SFQ60988.1 RNA polymerase sigma-70 factor, ECF subfamily [Bacillus sp. cl95]